MKAYKLFSKTPSGALRSYNIRWDLANKESFSPVCLKYEPGEWREPEIEGTGLFCLSSNKNVFVRGDEEMWEVEAEGQIELSDLIFDSFCSCDEYLIRLKIEQGKYARPGDIRELLDMFPNTVIYKRVKPIRKVAGGAGELAANQ